MNGPLLIKVNFIWENYIALPAVQEGKFLCRFRIFQVVFVSIALQNFAYVGLHLIDTQNSSLFMIIGLQIRVKPLLNFSPMSPKLVRTYPHKVENRGITMAPLFLRDNVKTDFNQMNDNLNETSMGTFILINDVPY